MFSRLRMKFGDSVLGQITLQAAEWPWADGSYKKLYKVVPCKLYVDVGL